MHAPSHSILVPYHVFRLSTAIVVPIARNPATISVELGLAFHGSTLSMSVEEVFDALKLESMRVHNQEVHDAASRLIDSLCHTAKLSRSVSMDAFQPEAFQTKEVVAAEVALQVALDAEGEAQGLLEEDANDKKMQGQMAVRSIEAIEAKRLLNEARHKAILEKLATLLANVSRPSMLGFSRRLGVDGLDKNLFASEKQSSKKASPQTAKTTSTGKTVSEDSPDDGSTKPKSVKPKKATSRSKTTSTGKTVSGDSPDGGSTKPKSEKPKKAASKRKFMMPKIRALSARARKEWTVILTSAAEASITPVPTTRILDRLPIFDLTPWDRDEYDRLAD